MVLVMRESDDPDADNHPRRVRRRSRPSRSSSIAIISSRTREGYLSGPSTAACIFSTSESRKAELLTNDEKFDESESGWSPDGTQDRLREQS